MNPAVQIPPDVEKVVSPHFELIVRLIENAWAKWLEGSGVIAQGLPLVRHRNRSIGSIMNDLLRAESVELCADNPQLRCLDKSGLFCVVIDNKVVVRFNLMNKNGMTLHTPTRQSRNYMEGQLSLHGFKPERFLYAGFVLDKTKTQILNIYLLERQHNGLPIWIEDVRHQFVYAQPSLFGTIPTTQTIEDQPKRVTAKKDTATGSQQLQTGTDDVPF